MKLGTDVNAIVQVHAWFVNTITDSTHLKMKRNKTLKALNMFGSKNCQKNNILTPCIPLYALKKQACGNLDSTVHCSWKKLIKEKNTLVV